jgi:hypothetical protein
MKVEIDGNSIRIRGDKVGKDRYLKIHCSEINGDDYYSVSVVKDGLEIGCGGSYFMNANHVVELTSRNGRRFID